MGLDGIVGVTKDVRLTHLLHPLCRVCVCVLASPLQRVSFIAAHIHGGV